MNTLFHIAFPVKNLQETRSFYVDLLGCKIGREATNWIDFSFFGHQVTVQENPELVCEYPVYRGGENSFPTYHFGAILPWKEWHALELKLRDLGVAFQIEPKLVFEGKSGEQKTMFIVDPNGYSIEFKTFEDSDAIFRK